MIRKEGDQFVLYTKDGKRKLFKSPSYAAVVAKEQQIEGFKARAREKRNKK